MRAPLRAAAAALVQCFENQIETSQMHSFVSSKFICRAHTCHGTCTHISQNARQLIKHLSRACGPVVEKSGFHSMHVAIVNTGMICLYLPCRSRASRPHERGCGFIAQDVIFSWPFAYRAPRGSDVLLSSPLLEFIRRKVQQVLD